MELHDYFTVLDDDGSLLIDLRGNELPYYRISSWREGCQVYVWDDAWIKQDLGLKLPSFALPTYRRVGNKYQHFIQYFIDIPSTILTTLSAFNRGQFMLLVWCAQFKEARQLLSNNPILLWMLVLDYGDEKGRTVRELLGMSQVKLLSLVTGRVKSKCHVNLLKKINIKDTVFNEDIEVIDSILSSDILVKNFALHQCININAFSKDFLETPELSYAFHLTKILLDKGNADYTRSCKRDIITIVRDSMRLGRVLDIERYQKIVYSVKSYEDLNNLHGKWTAKLNKKRYEEMLGKRNKVYDFPTPPISGTKEIVPIINSIELEAEGLLMDHCVASYIDECVAGESYIYKVLSPQRATLEVGVSVGLPQIKQLKLMSNASPSKETYTFVKEWLLNNKQGSLF